MLGQDTVEEVLTDLATLAETLGAQSIHVTFDDRTHRGESLMHPGLQDAQGPALICYIDGPALNSETITQLLARPTMLSPLPDENSARVANHEKLIYPKCGKRLVSCFTLTDCLQIITGRDFYVFDPTGKYLYRYEESSSDSVTAKAVIGSSGSSSKTQSGNSSIGISKAGGGAPVAAGNSAMHAKATNTSSTRTSQAYTKRVMNRAQKCALVGSRGAGSKGDSAAASKDDQDIINRFPDQFDSFLSLPFGLQEALAQTGSFRGVLIRMPLRKDASSLSEYLPNLSQIKAGIQGFRTVLRCSLVFGSCLVEGTASHWDADRSSFATDFEVQKFLFLILISL
jgi:hypothetical protein